MKLGKIKLKNIVDVQLSGDELTLLKGGVWPWACNSRACSSAVSVMGTYCLQGYGICKSGIIS
jgi:natural product precursor